MTNKQLEDLADEANIKGDNNLAIVLYVFLGARKVYLDGAFAEVAKMWAKERVKEMNLFDKRTDN